MDVLEKMTTYVRVVEAGSFSAAAKQLHVAPGAAAGRPSSAPIARVIGPPVLERRIARVAKRMAKAHAAEGCAPALTFRLR